MHELAWAVWGARVSGLLKTTLTHRACLNSLCHGTLYPMSKNLMFTSSSRCRRFRMRLCSCTQPDKLLFGIVAPFISTCLGRKKTSCNRNDSTYVLSTTKSMHLCFMAGYKPCGSVKPPGMSASIPRSLRSRIIFYIEYAMIDELPAGCPQPWTSHCI